MGRIRGVLLDIDGTLVDSNDAHARAWVDVLAEHGIRASVEEVRRLIGMGGDKLLPQVSGISEETEQGKQISKQRRERFLKHYLPTLRPTRGAKELLRHLHDGGYKMVIATSAKKEELEGLLKVCGGEGLIDGATTSDDAERSKPDPDIVQAALEKSELPPAQVVMLGDTPYDVEAATRAKVATVALRCGGWWDEGLAGAAAIYEDPADLLAHFDASPLA